MGQKFFKNNKTVVFFILLSLIFFFLMQRLSLIFWGYSHILYPGIDEPASGVLAADILDGSMRAPLFAYQYESRSGDSLIEGLLLVPFFKLFGRSILAIKLLALSSSLICLLCWVILLKKYQGALAAIIFALLFTLSPPMFARLNVMGTVDSHHIINPIIAIQLLLLFVIIRQLSNRRLRWAWFVFGFVSGIGAYAFYTYLMFVSFCLLFLLALKPQVTLQRTGLFMGGCFMGFMPWFWRTVYSPGGRGYLASVIKNTGFDIRFVMQNIFFNVPHSFDYSYPDRTLGVLSLLFYMFILFFIARLGVDYVRVLRQEKAPLADTSGASFLRPLQGFFIAAFPVYFLLCLSLSPMHIYPFEYVPSVGLFANFSSANIFRYRWLYVLFPFYFAIVAAGIAAFFTGTKQRSYKAALIIPLIIFLGCNSFKLFSLYATHDAGKILTYKGYSYDQFANRFILGDMVPRDVEWARSTTVNYPEINRGEAYRCYGTAVCMALSKDAARAKALENYLAEVPAPYIADFIYGVVRSVQNLTEPEFKPMRDAVIRKYPELFFENWGFRYLGYKYFGALVNKEMLLKKIPAVEQWFYGNFLNKFKQEFTDSSAASGKRALLDEISTIQVQYQIEVAKGLGMLVGAEMFFDPLHAPNYPLDSRFGEQFTGPLREAFYEGVGSGFAETLCRFWRMQLLPENADSPLYEKLLDIEWNRCNDLMSRFAAPYYPIMKKGFLKNLSGRHVSPGIKRYIHNKLILEKG
jgi:hypothetical protein